MNCRAPWTPELVWPASALPPETGSILGLQVRALDRSQLTEVSAPPRRLRPQAPAYKGRAWVWASGLPDP